MIKKVLIANRGEISLRVIRACRDLGIASVAVYSDADKDLPFVALADERVHVGPAPAMQSYLVIDKLIAACKQTGADAPHWFASRHQPARRAWQALVALLQN